MSDAFALDTNKVLWSGGVLMLVVFASLLGSRPRQAGYAPGSTEYVVCVSLAALFFVASWALMVFLVGYNASGDAVTADQRPKAVVTPVAAAVVIACAFSVYRDVERGRRVSWLPCLFFILAWGGFAAMVGFDDEPGKQDKVDGWRMSIAGVGAATVLTALYVVSKISRKMWFPDSSFYPLLMGGYILVLGANALITDETNLPGVPALKCPTDVT